MPTGPSKPDPYRPPKAERQSPPPRARAVSLEPLRERERQEGARRKGYSSTVMSRGKLGVAQTEKAKVLGGTGPTI